jgi:hypothetical protein
MEFKRINQDLFILYQGTWHKLNLEGPGALDLGTTKIDYAYENGLPISAVIATSNSIEELEFQEGLLRRRVVKKNLQDPGIIYHYLNNVFLATTLDGEIKPVVMRNRPRLTIYQLKDKTTFEVIDDKFQWLLSLDPNYRNQAQYGAPFAFQDYMKFYSTIQAPQHKYKSFNAKSGAYNVKWNTVDDYIDGEISITSNTINNVIYNAIATKSILEEETIINFRYVYTEGKVLNLLFIDGVEQKLSNGLLNDGVTYKGGFLVVQIRSGKSIAHMRFNTPYTDPDDEIRDSVRNILPLSSFE